MTFRRASTGDLHALVSLERQVFPSPWGADTFDATLEDPRCISALAVEDGGLAGYCLALDLSSTVHILNLAVHPAWRRRGIARRLVREVVAQAVESGKTCAVLEVRTSNTHARSLYASMGFTHVSTWRRYYTDTDEDAVIMVKDLRSRLPRDVWCEVVQNMEVARSTFHLILEGDLPQALPGQFAMIRVSSTSEPFLRRPLAVLGQKQYKTEFLFKVRGPGTDILARKRPGGRIKVLGPLGNGFGRTPALHVIYLAGGTGIPPVLSLAETMGRGIFILGARDAGDLPLLDRIHSIPGTRTVLMTEDGSCGVKGLATDALAEVLSGIDEPADAMIYACGPGAMLKAAARMAADKGVGCEVSLEERMSCGFGACAGCVTKTRNGSMRVCREGPVFPARELVWD